MQSVQERVLDIISQNLGIPANEIKLEESLVNDLGADSLDLVEIVMEMEEEFDINIPDEAAQKIETVQQAIDYVKEQNG